MLSAVSFWTSLREGVLSQGTARDLPSDTLQWCKTPQAGLHTACRCIAMMLGLFTSCADGLVFPKGASPCLPNEAATQADTPHDSPRNQLKACTVSTKVPLIMREICPSRSEQIVSHHTGLLCSAPDYGGKHIQGGTRRSPGGRPSASPPPEPPATEHMLDADCRPRDWLGRGIHSGHRHQLCTNLRRGDARGTGIGSTSWDSRLCALHLSSPGARGSCTPAWFV